MKTRRILAASTAALLAFGTTAAYVASATETATATEVTVDNGDVASNALAGAITVASDATDFTVKVTGLTGVTGVFSTGTADATKVKVVGGSNPSVTSNTLSVKLDVPSSGTTASFTYALYDTTTDDGATFNTAVTVTITITKAAADDTSEPEAPVAQNFDDDGDAVALNGDIKVSVKEADFEKFENDDDEYKMSGTTLAAATAAAPDSKGKVYVDTANDPVIKGLSDNLKKEFKKVEASKVKTFGLQLENDGKIYHTAPAPITVTVHVPKALKGAKVYHVDGKNIELLKSEQSLQYVSDEGYDISFTTKNFSDFIITTAEIKNAKTTNANNDPTSSTVGETSNGSSTTNPDTGIALAIAPVVLAAGAVAVVALKKKH